MLAQDTLKRSFFAAFPVVFYLPETGLGVGGTGLYTFYMNKETEQNNPSAINFTSIYTFKKQLLFFTDFDVFTENNDKRYIGELGYYRYLYNHFGIGENSQKNDLETFRVNYPRARFAVIKRIKGNWLAGPLIRYDDYNISEVEQGGLLENNEFVTSGHRSIFQYGAQIVYDSRDYNINTTKGLYMDLKLINSTKNVLSQRSFFRSDLNMSAFFSLKENHVLGVNSYWGFTAGETPFYQYYYVGGAKRGRGIADRRFMDEHLVSHQIEYRFPIWKRIGGVAFTSGSNVKPTIGDLFLAPNIWTFGAGIRFQLTKDQRMRIRLDYGYHKEGGNMYLTINEAF